MFTFETAAFDAHCAESTAPGVVQTAAVPAGFIASSWFPVPIDEGHGVLFSTFSVRPESEADPVTFNVPEIVVLVADKFAITVFPLSVVVPQTVRFVVIVVADSVTVPPVSMTDPATSSAAPGTFPTPSHRLERSAWSAGRVVFVE